jgi:WD40 repeat protein
MGVIFISHSSRNNSQAVEVRDWLRANGWRDTFLDLDPAHGLAPGQRWQEELKRAGERCAAVVVLISSEWVESKWCQVEFLLASQLGKRIFAVVIAPIILSSLPIELTAHYQLADISNPATAADGLERLKWGLKRAGLDPADFLWPPPENPERTPYRGLRSLEEKDAGVFFGREAAITRGLDALRRMRDGAPERLLVVLGASGAGKSSFLKAGLLARLHRDDEQFLVLPAVRPARAAMTGPEGLLHALGVSTVPTEAALTRRLADVRAPVIERLTRFAIAAREIHAAPPPTLVLPIDQGEELFGSESTESPAFFELMRAVLHVDANLVVVLTIRSDSYSALQGERRLGDVPRLLFDLPPLSLTAFRQVIEGPGRLVQPNIVFEPELVDRLLADMDQADALPLLAFTLERLVAECGGDHKIELVEYEQKLGGLAGTIDKAIEAALTSAMADPSLPSDRSSLEKLSRRAFIPWLVKVDDAEGAPKRRVTALRELPEETRSLVQHFVNQRLLLSDVRGDGESLEVCHESVLRHWTKLSRWIDEERANLLALDSARAAADEWRRHQSAQGNVDEWLVHRGERLIQAEALLHQPDYARLLTDEHRAYLAACRRREQVERVDAEERLRRDQQRIGRQRRLQRWTAAALVLVGLVILAFGGVAIVQSRATSREASLVLADYARRAITDGQYERAVRFAALAAQEGPLTVPDPVSGPMLAAAAEHSSLRFSLPRRQSSTSWSSSPNGQRALSFGDEGVRLWDTITGRELTSMTHQQGPIGLGAIFAPDGQRVLAWLGGDTTVHVWDAISGRDIAHMDHANVIGGAQFAKDGRRVLSWDLDRIVCVWDTSTGLEVSRQTHEGGVGGAAFDADDHRVVSWGLEDHTVLVWDAMSGHEIARRAFTDDVHGAAFATSGAVFSWRIGEDAVSIWNVTAGREVVRQQSVKGAVFAPDYRSFVLVHVDGTVSIWNTAFGREIARRRYESVVDAVFSFDGKRLLLTGEDGSVRVWDAESGRETLRLTHAGLESAAFSRDGARVLSWGYGGIVRVWDMDRGAEIARQTHGNFARGVFGENGRILSWGDDGVARVWDATTSLEIARQTHDSAVVGAVFIGAGDVLSWDKDGFARLWRASGHEIARYTHEFGILGSSFSADGRRVLSWSDQGEAVVWDATSGQEVARQIYPCKNVQAMFGSSDEQVFSWCVDQGTGSLWNATSGEVIVNINKKGAILGAAFGADGWRLLSRAADNIITVSDVRSGREIARKAHEGGIASAVLGADGNRMLLQTADGTIRVCEMTTGREVMLPSHAVLRVIMSRDGRRVLSWGGETVHVFETESGRETVTHRHVNLTAAAFAGNSNRVLSWSRDDGSVHVWEASSGRDIVRTIIVGGLAGVVVAPDGRRAVAQGDDGAVRMLDLATGVEIARYGLGAVSIGVLSVAGDRIVSFGLSPARIWDVSWTVPRDSNRTFIAEVCERILPGSESTLASPFTNGRGEAISNASIRRITMSDALAAPVLRDRVGEDVCRTSWSSQIAERINLLFVTAKQ